MRILLVASLYSTFLFAACEEKTQSVTRFELVFHVADAHKQGLGNIPIRVGETEIGKTDRNGSLVAEVNARDGDRYTLAAPCPAAYKVLEIPAEVVFLDTKGLEGNKNTTIEIQVVCKRRLQVAALLVHADGHEGMPILVDGVKQGVTGPGGFAHLRLEGESNSQFRVSLDTSLAPTLVPQNPRHDVQLGDDDGLFVFEPVFSKAEPKAKPKRRRRRRAKSAEPTAPAKPSRPIKID